MRSLIAFSSGYDSLYIAWKYLTETNNDVTLFFMDMSLLQKQEEVESYINPFQKYTSIQSHEWMKENFRDHKLKIHFVDKMDHKYDHTKMFCKITAELLNENLYDEVLHGAAGVSTNQKSIYKYNRCDVMIKEFERVAKRGKLRFPLKEWGKHTAHQIQELPKEMRKLAISCNFAKPGDNGHYVKCGNCHKCYRNIVIRNALEDGCTPDQALDRYIGTDRAKEDTRLFFKSKDAWGYFDEVK